MRYLICVALGLLVGAISATTASNILRQHHAWPRGVMSVLQHELGTTRELARTNRCKEPASAAALARLDLLSQDIKPSILPTAQDRVFDQYVTQLRTAIANASAQDADCAHQSEALSQVANACSDCHRDYR